MGVEAALPLQVMPDNTAFAILNQITPRVILEHIALGRTHTEIASMFKVPQMAFRKWIVEAVDRNELNLATTCGADALVTRALYITSLHHATSEEQRAMKDLAKQMVNAAMCMAPDKWMPQKISGTDATTQGAVAVNVFTAAAQQINATTPAPTKQNVQAQQYQPPQMPGNHAINAPSSPTVGPSLPPTQANPGGTHLP